jgi:LacI family transcriptional regulator
MEFIILLILASRGEDQALKKATSNDVARLAGVSQTAVSLILNESEKISFSEDTKERVFTAARKLGYSLPNRRKKEKKTPNLILVFTPTL